MPVLSTLGAAIANVYGFTSGLIKDQYFNLVSLLLPGNGTNGKQNNSFKDSSVNDFLITPNGNATQGTFSPFSQTGWGAYFGSSTANIVFASDASFGVGTGNFSVELSVNFTAWTGNQTLFYQGTSVTGYITLDKPSSGNTLRFSDPNGVVISYAWTPNIGQWYNIAVVRAGTGANQTTLYIDGVAVATGQSTGSVAASTIFVGGLNYISSYNIQGYISNLRYSNVARTITNPTSFFSSDANTLLLTCRSNRFVDISGTPKTISQINGTTSVTPFSPFAPTAAYSAAAVGGSGYFDGTGDYLTIANQTALQLPGDFTIDGWVYGGDLGNVSGQSIIGDYFRNNAEATNQYQITWNKLNKQMAFYLKTSGGSVYIATSNGTAPSFSWNHFALVRSGSTIRLYCNGVGTSTATDSTQLNSGGGTWIGVDANNTGEIFNGYIANLRVVKGTAIYDPSQSTLTVPTALTTAVSGTSLLLNFTNAGVVDATAKNVLETVGNAQISTTQSKWGGGSIRFDGTSNTSCMIAQGRWQPFFGANFSIEMWFRVDSLSGVQTLISQDWRRGIDGPKFALFIGEASSDRLTYFANGGAISIIAGAGNAISANTWYFVQVIKSGSTTTMYLNGTSIGSATDTYTYPVSTYATYIGRSDPGGSIQGYLTGYIDDLRITIGQARTAGTATAPFPLQ